MGKANNLTRRLGLAESTNKSWFPLQVKITCQIASPASKKNTNINFVLQHMLEVQCHNECCFRQWNEEVSNQHGLCTGRQEIYNLSACCTGGLGLVSCE